MGFVVMKRCPRKNGIDPLMRQCVGRQRARRIKRTCIGGAWARAKEGGTCGSRAGLGLGRCSTRLPLAAGECNVRATTPRTSAGRMGVRASKSPPGNANTGGATACGTQYGLCCSACNGRLQISHQNLHDASRSGCQSSLS